ncbi:MAG: hypothetical protein JWM80_4360 [Cyanobacteria bacterium RYN_339]|nr:hypothetical protein [Cyanobacteria bacterium RYN_339]
MASFTYQVDRVHKLKQALTFFPSPELAGEAFTVPEGGEVVYRGLVILDNKPRFCFDVDGKKGYTSDEARLVTSLEENFDALVKP